MMESKLFKWGVLAPAAFLLWSKAVGSVAYFVLVGFLMLSPSGIGV